MTYARLTEAGTVEFIDDARWAALAPTKQATWLPYSEDAQPVPAATEVLVNGGVVFTANAARQAWSLRQKTTAELADYAIAAERSKIDEVITELDAQRAVTRATWDGYTANQLRAEQWRDRQVLLRFAHLLARQVKAGSL
jgi:hypothetical protein